MCQVLCEAIEMQLLRRHGRTSFLNNNERQKNEDLKSGTSREQLGKLENMLGKGRAHLRWVLYRSLPKQKVAKGTLCNRKTRMRLESE